MRQHHYALNTNRLAIAGMVTLALAGCGGGGGDSGGTTLVGNVDVTAANQDQLSRAAAAAAQGGFTGSMVPLAADRAHAMSVTRSGGASVSDIVRTAWNRALQTPGGVEPGRAHIAAVAAPIVQPCLVSGTTTLTLDDRDNNGGASVNDALTVVFNACVDFANETMNGTLTTTLTSVALTPSLSFGATATLAGLTMTMPGHSARYDGDFTMSYAEPSATVATTHVVVGNQLVIQASTVNFNDTFTLMAGHTIDSTYDAAALPPGGTVPGRTTTTTSGRVASASAGGYVAVTTLQPIVQYDVDTAPRSGQLNVVGKSGSLQLTALPGNLVQIDVDANGDGKIDQTKTVDWDWIF